MSNKPLIKTNPYLKNPAKRHAMFCMTVASSTAIEGVHKAVEMALKTTKISAKPSVSQNAKTPGKSRC
jgi:hypothetical protein